LETSILYEEKKRPEGEWAEITLNRPQKGNALTLPMLFKIDDCVQRLKASRNIRALVLRGTGRFFCTGATLRRGVR